MEGRLRLLISSIFSCSVSMLSLQAFTNSPISPSMLHRVQHQTGNQLTMQVVNSPYRSSTHHAGRQLTIQVDNSPDRSTTHHTGRQIIIQVVNFTIQVVNSPYRSSNHHTGRQLANATTITEIYSKRLEPHMSQRRRHASRMQRRCQNR